MNKRIRSMSVTVLAVMAMMAMMTTTAFAQYPTAQPFGISCTSAGQAGASVTCTVVGAYSGEQLTVTASYGSTEFYSEVLSANEEGEATFRFTAPREARGQLITVSVVGEQSGAIADEIAMTAPGRTGEEVSPGRSGEAPGRLARTGQDTILLGAAGLVLLTGGVIAIRRRRVGADERVDA